MGEKWRATLLLGVVVALLMCGTVSVDASGTDQLLSDQKNQVELKTESQRKVLYFTDAAKKLPKKYHDDKTGLAALKVLVAAVINKREQATPQGRQGKGLKKKKKKFLALLAAAQAVGAAPVINTPSQEEVEGFIQDIEELATIFGDGPTPSPESLFSGTDMRLIWDLISGAQFSQVTDQLSETFESLFDVAPVTPPIFDAVNNPIVNPLTDMMAPVLEILENNDLSELLDISRLREYITGNTEENNSLMQFIQILSPRNYEFPASCNTTRAYTSRFKQGHCVRLADCYLFEGESFGTCGLGTGSCCVFHHSCGHISNEWISHFTDHEDMEEGPGTGPCLFTLEPRHPNICQYRVDFENFDIEGPNEESVCDHDFVEVFGGSKIPRLCGHLTGQHFYVDVEPGGFMQISVYTSSSKYSKRHWNIKITQINCDSQLRAPSGCLQFYNGTEGVVFSFNHRLDASPRDQQMNMPGGTNYGICVHSTPGYCALMWQEVGEQGFSLSGIQRKEQETHTGTEQCQADYVSIPGAVFREPISRTLMEDTRFCGTRLPKIITNRQPYIMRVVTNANENGDSENSGFYLAYKQIKCIE